MQSRPPPHRRPAPSRRSEPAHAPVRLGRPRLPSPFAPGREIAFARVEGTGLEAIGIREGDHVALARGLDVVDVELAAVVGDDGTSALWACTREGARLRVGLGDQSGCGAGCGAGCRAGGARASPLAPRHTRVQGVVIAVLRRSG